MFTLKALTTAAALITAAAAFARPVDVCNPAIPYTMPDHDQVRSPAFGIVGLQNNGSQYCVPTCTMDILTYLGNHGYPALSAGPGPGPWLGNQAIYNAFGTDIEALAGLMNTDPVDGTGGTNAFAGVNDWIDNAGYNGDIIVSMFGMNLNSAPELGDIAFSLIARCPISISVGWYISQPNNVYVRDGGHCVAVSRLPDFCSPFPKISIKDPGNSTGSNAFSQAAGTTETYNVTPNLLITRRKASDNSLVYQGPAVRISGYASNGKTAIIDGYRAYFPAFGLSACNNPVNGSCVQHHIPNNTIAGSPGPATTPISMPAGATVHDLAIAADNLSSWVLATDVDGRDFLIWQRGGSPAPQSFPSLDPFNPRRICAGRDSSTLFLLDQNPHLVVRLDTATGVATPMSLAAPATAICFDHQRNELVALSSASRTVTRIDADTLVPGVSRTLPSSVALGTHPRIAICPVGAYVWLTSGTPTGYGLINSGSGAMSVAGTISSTQAMRGVDTTDRGNVVTNIGGRMAEFAACPAGGCWIELASTQWNQLGDGPIFRIAKSHTNYDRAIHDQPEETLALLPDTFAPSVPDCKADFNFSGTVTVQDIFDLSLIHI